MRPRSALLAVLVLLAAGCSGDSGDRTPVQATPGADSLVEAVTVDRLQAHLEALQRIADANGGTRASGTPGYDASVDYVVGQLRDAGYEPRLHRFAFIHSQELAAPELALISPDPREYAEQSDFVAFRYSGSGKVSAPLVVVDARSETSGCEPQDFEAFDRGSVALLRRGGCFFVVKVGNAVEAGAAAVLVFNDGSPGHENAFEATLVSTASVPALSLASDVGEDLVARASSGEVRVRVSASFEAVERQTANIVADLPGSSSDEPALLIGGHLDSIASGPGLNDNGSGVAAILEIARQARRLGLQPEQPVRFAFWAAEEVGLVGSTEYVESLGDVQEEIGAVVNLDMVGSPNAEAFVYDGDAAIQEALTQGVRAESLDPIPIELDGRSDHAPFAEAGVPVGGLITGVDDPGPNGEPHDPCYHQPCDTIENVDVATVEQMADVVVRAVFGRLTSSSR